ncbi:uncharacterized protein N7503_011519 [Penicillium pulvis]|uniref:uncharacterized protein n=1 Tax=Penicillium pulvis TaxID=1562058 RepID=UPI0025490052|nr:uncharacterized protein N7503_011519 [Penicillium pulvis]KAJ5786307.1 hypothetical protein N7503_011519 [Penicillium pulvis]
MASRRIKDGPMACPKSSIQPYTNELKKLRDHCLALLGAHEEDTPDTLWDKDDQDPVDPGTDYDMSLLKLATDVVIENGKHIFPPPYTRLSDELVYFATKFLKSTTRGRNYPYDFQPRGDIDPNRVPSGVGPIVWAHGLPFFPVYKGYYILCGRKHADWIGWILHGKNQATMREYPIWTIGPVVAPGSAIALDRTAERQMLTHKLKNAKECEKSMEKSPVARDVVSDKHFDGSVVPRDSKGGFMITPIYRVQGYSPKVGPNAPDGSRSMIMGKAWFTKNRIDDFDWEATSKLHYTNERHPMIYGDDEAVEDDDEVVEDGDEEVESDNETNETCFMDETEDTKTKAQEEVNMDDEVEGDTEIIEPTMDEITDQVVHEKIAQMKTLDIAEPEETSQVETLAPEYQEVAEEAIEKMNSQETAPITEKTEAQDTNVTQSHPAEMDVHAPLTSQLSDGTSNDTSPGHATQNTENEGKDQETDHDTCVLVAEDYGRTSPGPNETKIQTDA